MENQVLLMPSRASAQPSKTTKSEDFKYLLEQIIQELEELTFEINVQPKPENKTPVKKDPIYLKLSEEFPECLEKKDNISIGDHFPKSEQIHRLLDRLQTLQEFYNLLMTKVKTTLDNLKSIFDPELYNFILTKREHLSPKPSVKSEISRTDRDECPPSTSSSKNASSKQSKRGEARNESKKRKRSSLQPDTSKKHDSDEYPKLLGDLMIIGPNGTTIREKDCEGLELKSPLAATRLLCDVIFGDDVLATHSLTGNQSPAFRGRERPSKKQLDPLKVADITHFVCSKFSVNQQIVRSTITTKCADSAKKLKRLLSKTL